MWSMTNKYLTNIQQKYLRDWKLPDMYFLQAMTMADMASIMAPSRPKTWANWSSYSIPNPRAQPGPSRQRQRRHWKPLAATFLNVTPFFVHFARDKPAFSALCGFLRALTFLGYFEVRPCNLVTPLLELCCPKSFPLQAENIHEFSSQYSVSIPYTQTANGRQWYLCNWFWGITGSSTRGSGIK